MATLSLRPMRDDDHFVLRDEDVQAIELQGFATDGAFAHSAHISTEAFTAEVDGEAVAAWGYASHSIVGTTAYGWLLTSPSVNAHSIMFLRASRYFLSYILERFPRIEVLVHEPHEVSHRWLTWLGFTPCGRDGEFLILEKVR